MTVARNSRAGVAALEFALVLPVLLLLFLGTIDLSDALLTARRMSLAAGSIAETATTSSAQTRALIVATAKLNGLNPETYLKEVLAKIAEGHTINRIEELLPWRLIPAVATSPP